MKNLAVLCTVIMLALSFLHVSFGFKPNRNGRLDIVVFHIGMMNEAGQRWTETEIEFR